MARINIIHPKYLTDQHLIAEHREINLAVAMIRNITTKKMPERFTLNKGHVVFFSNKVAYLKKRYAVIDVEMERRGFKSHTKFLGEDLVKNSKPYKPVQADVEIIVERIIAKIKLRPKWYRYEGKPIDDKKYIAWLKTIKLDK
jgi:deoxyribonuclease (pyrimidine dimer)